MRRRQLRHKYLKLRSNKSKSLYPRHKNYRKALISNTEMEFYANLNIKDITDNRKFWKTVKPLFSGTINQYPETLTENKTAEVNNSKAVVIVNNYF